MDGNQRSSEVIRGHQRSSGPCGPVDGNPQYVVLMLSKMALLVRREIVHDDHRRRRVDDEGMAA